MRTLTVAISDLEYNKLGLKKDQLSFAEFLELVSKEINKQHLQQSLLLAKNYGLSNMTMEEITKEVQAVRKNAEGNS